MTEEEKKEFLRIKSKYKQTWLDNFDMDFLINLSEKLQKENEKLENDNKYLRGREIYLEKRREDIINLFQNQQTNTTIPIQKIKDKIKELKKKVEELTDEKGYWGGSDLLDQIEVLQELLESEE